MRCHDGAAGQHLRQVRGNDFRPRVVSQGHDTFVEGTIRS